MNNTKASQKAIIFNQKRKILILRRSETAPYRALAWDLPGGETWTMERMP